MTLLVETAWSDTSSLSEIFQERMVSDRDGLSKIEDGLKELQQSSPKAKALIQWAIQLARSSSNGVKPLVQFAIIILHPILDAHSKALDNNHKQKYLSYDKTIDAYSSFETVAKNLTGVITDVKDVAFSLAGKPEGCHRRVLSRKLDAFALEGIESFDMDLSHLSHGDWLAIRNCLQPSNALLQAA